ncbi:MAG: excinuclease ABC subunit UvrA [Candidatus Dojkabacteria bacterium]
MGQEFLRVKGARVHNLKNVSVEIPKGKLTVITGVSGSGKSSLAFDTIYAEGQRRYVESLSAYARQFLGLMDKPDVDYIEGLSPAISIDQKSAGHNPRSTVGTVTEIFDYLRLLFARAGHPHSPKTGRRLQSQSVQEIVDAILQKEGKAALLSPVVKNRKGTYEELFSRFLAQGFVRARVDGEFYSLEEEISLDRYKKHNIEIVVDRLVLNSDRKEDSEFSKRLTDSVETAMNLAGGELYLVLLDTQEEVFFSENLVDPETGESFPQIEPHSFSFNSPHGACERCSGLGVVSNIDVERSYNPDLSVSEGGIYPWSKIADNPDSWNMQLLKAVAAKEGIDLRVPMNKLSEEELNILFFGGKGVYEFRYIRQSDGIEGTYQRKFEGVANNLLRRYRETDSKYIRAEIEKYMREDDCPVCEGKRLNKNSLAVTIAGKNIYEIGELPISGFQAWISSLTQLSNSSNEDALTQNEKDIVKQVLKEIQARADFLLAVGLNYLTLNRTAKTLSGGESQRIRLASQIGTGLTGVLYVLDEPSIGLHQRDNQRLLDSLKGLKELGNTVLVVEHDEDTIRQADYVLDIGPKAGEHGGELVGFGSPSEFVEQDTLTAKYLSGKLKIDRKQIESLVKKITPKYELKTKNKDKNHLEIINPRQNNLKIDSVSIPLNKFVVVTGVSGSGKSSLINEVLYPSLMREIYGSRMEVGEVEKIIGLEQLDKVVGIDQSPIGRTPRSNPATYTGVFVAIRELFASTKEAKERGYKAGRFSFNTKGGRCENCQGDGVLRIEMQFLPDVYVECDVCHGKRYNRETLQIDYKGKNIADVLQLTVSEALDFFENIPAVNNKLRSVSDVGLGYIRLGQSATTLSGGEAQRVKLASELSKRQTGNTIYILDEPTTGLHFDDINKLLVVLHSLVAKGNTVITIEHNLDFIKTADWLIDLGPEGGDGGGELVAAGTVEEVAANEKSYTGQWLRKII